MTTRNLLPIMALAALFCGCAVYAYGDNDNDLQHEHRTLTLATKQITRLQATTGAGELKIIAAANSDEIRVEAEIYTDGDNTPELSLSTSGTSANLVAQFDQHHSFQRQSPYINLIVYVPEDLPLTVVDGSGPIEISGSHADMDITDGSGSLTVDGANHLSLSDGSGSIDLQHIASDIELKDGSGSLTIRDCGGDITIHDGSGSIDISEVAGSVTITDGSGSIDVDQAAALNIIESGSGGVQYHHIKGSVSIH